MASRADLRVAAHPVGPEPNNVSQFRRASKQLFSFDYFLHQTDTQRLRSVELISG